MQEAAKSIRQEKRRREILSATLSLVRRHGTDVTTAQIAARAKCSKETLYLWFGDRDGIMRALVTAQAAAMGEALARAFDGVSGDVRERLVSYCTALIDILTGEAVLAVNRIAMAQACTEQADLGLDVVDQWQANVVAPFVELAMQAEEGGLATFEDAEEAVDVLFALLIGDRQRRLLLGEQSRPDMDTMARLAETAVDRWLILHPPR